VASGALSVTPAAAHAYEKGDIQVRHPWSRATPPGAATAAGYLEIRNSGREPDRLLGASTPAAERVELHVTVREGDVVRMREIAHLEVPARQRVTLRPGGPHLMIIGLKKPFARGERVPVNLRFERAGELQVMIEVQAGDTKKPHH
jgi:copper(I)-binding protein